MLLVGFGEAQLGLLEEQRVGVEELQPEQAIRAHQWQDLRHFYRREGDGDSEE